MIHILIAPNAFKNSLSASAAADEIKNGLLQSDLSCTCDCFPVGDGGDGTGGLIISRCGGFNYKIKVADPLGRLINANIGVISDGKVCVIEMADASGLRLLSTEDLNPLNATSYGTGQLIKEALDRGVDKIVLCMGGSATVDGGCGILMALGARFLDGEKKELKGIPGTLTELKHIDLSFVDKRIFDVELIVLCDVDNDLLGVTGAATIFGPQKGATEQDVKTLEAGLEKLRDIALQQTFVDMAAIRYGGTAGGAAAGLQTFLNAKLVNGIEYFLELTGFSQAIAKADLVITGEGSIDEQTLQGKGPFGIAIMAKEKNIPVIALAGRVPLEPSKKMLGYFTAFFAVGNSPSNLADALADTPLNLKRTSMHIGNTIEAGLKLIFKP